MSENEPAPVAGAPDTTTESPVAEAVTEDISYHAVEKDGVVTAIWEKELIPAFSAVYFIPS